MSHECYHTAGQPFVETCLDGRNSLSLVPLRIWYFFYVFLPVRIRNECQCAASTVIGTWVQVAVHSKRLSLQVSLDVEILPVHIIWAFMLEDICFSPPTEENSVTSVGCIISEAKALFPCLERGFLLWGQQLLPVCSPLPWATPSGYFLKDLRSTHSQAMTAGAIHPYSVYPLGTACHKKGSKCGWSWTISVQRKHFSLCCFLQASNNWRTEVTQVDSCTTTAMRRGW